MKEQINTIKPEGVRTFKALIKEGAVACVDDSELTREYAQIFKKNWEKRREGASRDKSLCTDTVGIENLIILIPPETTIYKTGTYILLGIITAYLISSLFI